MSTRPEMPETAPPNLTTSPSWNASLRLTKEQLAAAERTREYHVRKLQEQVNRAEYSVEPKGRKEH